MMQSKINRPDSGVTSIFIVLFATLLFTVITVGFLSLMTSDQRRAIDSEWSEGAYDSALSGVEDGKRVLAMCRDDPNPASDACAAIAAGKCDTIATAGIVDQVDGEVLLQSHSGSGLVGGTVNQAYSCVIVRRDTPDYRGSLGIGKSVTIPLESGGKDYDRLTLSWFSREDSTTGATLSPLSGGAGMDSPLPSLTDGAWQSTRPPIMRTQFMQYDQDSPIALQDFDRGSYAHTVFLYPSATGLPDASVDIATDDYRNPGILDDPSEESKKKSPRQVICEEDFPELGYSCSVSIALPDIPSGRRAALLRLTAHYGGASYRVQMMMGTEVVNFMDVQPSIDSTGRAGDVFRRVDARIDMSGAASDPYPRAAIDVTEGLCKNFSIGVGAVQWSCDP